MIIFALSNHWQPIINLRFAKPLNLELKKFCVLQVDAYFKHCSGVSFQMLIGQKGEYCNNLFCACAKG